MLCCRVNLKMLYTWSTGVPWVTPGHCWPPHFANLRVFLRQTQSQKKLHAFIVHSLLLHYLNYKDIKHRFMLCRGHRPDVWTINRTPQMVCHNANVARRCSKIGGASNHIVKPTFVGLPTLTPLFIPHTRHMTGMWRTLLRWKPMLDMQNFMTELWCMQWKLITPVPGVIVLYVITWRLTVSSAPGTWVTPRLSRLTCGPTTPVSYKRP